MVRVVIAALWTLFIACKPPVQSQVESSRGTAMGDHIQPAQEPIFLVLQSGGEATICKLSKESVGAITTSSPGLRFYDTSSNFTSAIGPLALATPNILEKINLTKAEPCSKYWEKWLLGYYATGIPPALETASGFAMGFPEARLLIQTCALAAGSTGHHGLATGFEVVAIGMEYWHAQQSRNKCKD